MSGQLKKDSITVINASSSSFLTYILSIPRNSFLISVFVKRDLKAIYSQTLLGPLWLIAQPLISSLILFLIFNRVFGSNSVRSTGVSFIFFYCGIALWSLHSEIVNSTSNIFRDNAYIYSKVYFPRIITAVSVLLSRLVRFFFQFMLLILVDLVFFQSSSNILVNSLMAFSVAVLLAVFSMSYGIFVSSVSKKYKDLLYLNSFIVQLWMFITPVFYDPSMIQDERVVFFLKLNPLYSFFNLFRASFLHVSFGNQFIFVFFEAFIFFIVATFLFMKAESKAVEEI